MGLGDVVVDGAQELIVLETGDDGLERVAVWRWHGWGFSLLWRSAPGRYRDLVLIGGEMNEPVVVTRTLQVASLTAKTGSCFP